MTAGFSADFTNDVLRIQLNNPPMNTLTIPQMDAIAGVISEAGNKARAIVVQSDIPGCFSFGIDPKAVLSTDLSGRQKIFVSLGNLVKSFLAAGVPIVTLVEGPAMAGGAVLAALGDYVVMHEGDAKVCFSEAKVGLPLPGFVQMLVKEKCGPQNFFEIGVMARNMTADLAKRMGFTQATFSESADGQKRVDEILQKIGRLSGVVLRKTLLDSRQPMLLELDRFLKDQGEFVPFLSDEYLGAGLRNLQ